MTTYKTTACIVLLSLATLGARCGSLEDDPEGPIDTVVEPLETINDVEG